jgi:hypothetical protein
MPRLLDFLLNIAKNRNGLLKGVNASLSAQSPIMQAVVRVSVERNKHRAL